MAFLLDTSILIARETVTQMIKEPSVNTANAEEMAMFRKVFDQHKPTAIKPISHDSTAVLLLSFDSESEGSGNLKVTEEVRIIPPHQ
jgi:hypothetical protein